LVGLVGWYG